MILREAFGAGAANLYPMVRVDVRSRKSEKPVSLRLDPDILAHFRRTGRGWQSRINAALRKVAKLPEKKRKKA